MLYASKGIEILFICIHVQLLTYSTANPTLLTRLPTQYYPTRMFYQVSHIMLWWCLRVLLLINNTMWNDWYCDDAFFFKAILCFNQSCSIPYNTIQYLLFIFMRAIKQATLLIRIPGCSYSTIYAFGRYMMHFNLASEGKHSPFENTILSHAVNKKVGTHRYYALVNSSLLYDFIFSTFFSHVQHIAIIDQSTV